MRNPKERVLASAGIGIAGDSFDAKIVRHLVAPLVGRGSQWRPLGKTGTVPNWPFAKLEHWHHLPFLKSNENMEALRTMRKRAVKPDKIAQVQDPSENFSAMRGLALEPVAVRDTRRRRFFAQNVGFMAVRMDRGHRDLSAARTVL